MHATLEQLPPSLTALCFAAATIVGWRIGWWSGRRVLTDLGEDPGNKFTDSSLALLGLLLGFTFSMSLSRHDQRRLMVVTESNAIGDFYTCASLLTDPGRTALQTVIRDYAKAKLAVTHGPISKTELDLAITHFTELQGRMTELVRNAISEGTPIVVPLTNTLNDVSSSGAARLAAYHDRLPAIIVLLLFMTSVVPAFLMGQQQGALPKVHITGTLSFVFLVTAVTYVTLDLNQPGKGSIRVSQEPMERLIASISQ
ncbi:bestrophin-like domain [Schlesneria paludicola]|uniref:bestrophin-like domain n=1 Tax=Schlesneria paludicola TaxID=360056 RepID=UPI0004927C59|nr:DUF4239 domain-containing protein [Schlesneria paludicola]